MPVRELRLDRGHLGDPEVEDPDAPAGGHDDIGRLDVPVHHSGGVGVREAGGDLDRVVDRTIQRQWPTPDLLLEGLALVEGHDDDELPFLRLRDIEEAAEVRVVE